ncbi:MAG TPA: hypothetical protein VF816_14975 [Rhodocyclaceae bacterium]
MPKFDRTILPILFAGLLSACAAPRKPDPIEQGKLASIKTIAIATPSEAKYFAFVGAAPVTTFAGGPAGASVASGAIAGFLTGSSQSRAAGFDGFVKHHYPGVDLNREFLNALKSGLRSEGYDVIEFAAKPIGTDKPTAPSRSSAVTADSVLAAKPDDIQADAVMALDVSTSYAAPGPLNSFTRAISLRVLIAESRSRTLLLSRFYDYDKHFSDVYSYRTYGALTEDISRAFEGLRQALLSLVPEVCGDLHKSGT